MKTVFLALNFHLKTTKSSQFFIDILEEKISDFNVINVNNAWYDIPRIKPDTVIIWQHIFSPKEIDSWGAKNIIFIPMYDACPHTEEFWNQYKKYKIFCFSKTLYNFLHIRDFTVMYSQYYIKPQAGKQNVQKMTSVFYWERSTLIDWNLIKSILGTNSIHNLHYHKSSIIAQSNPSQPTSEDISLYNISFSDWFESKDDYKKMLQKISIYIAPRESEGIGLSFIEALSHGCCIIAYDAPTMNEYIKHGINGYLFTENNVQELDFSELALQKLCKNASQSSSEGWKTWCNSVPNIIDFIQTPLLHYYPKTSMLLCIKKRLKAEIRYIIKGKD